MGGGGVRRKFESFVGNLGGFAPPPEKVNFRHWSHVSDQVHGIHIHIKSILDQVGVCLMQEAFKNT